MSKRGRSDSSDLESITSETYPNSQSGTKKKTKNGWPEGKPRKHFSTPQTDTDYLYPTLTDGPQQSSQQPIISKLSEIQIIKNENSPFVLAIQETHLKPNESLRLRSYQCFRKDVNPTYRARGGVAIFVRNNIPTKDVRLVTNLQATAVQIEVPLRTTICNIHLPDCGSPTYFEARSGKTSVIDLSLCSPHLATRLAWDTDEDLHSSDHFPITIHVDVPTKSFSTRERWLTKNADWEKFSDHVNIPNLPNDIEIAVDSISSAILNAAKISIPISKPSKTHQRRRGDSILNAKKTSWEEYISSINPEVGLGEIWRKIRVIAGKNTMDSPVSLNYDNRVISDPVEICEAFANHFAQNSCSDIYEEDFMNVKTYEERNILNFNTPHILHYNLPFSVNELDFALENYSEAAAGHDNILYSMIIHLPINEKLKLLELYNKIWDSGTYPKVWKIAIIIPILKPTKSPMDPNNYRLISLTSCLGKVFEKMVNLRFSWWIESNNLISQFQVGCRSRRSTTDALVFLESEIQDTFRNREHLVAVSFDLQKAYDRTWRFSIMQQLHTWGLRGNMAICIQSFPQDRTFQVRIGAIDSSYRTLDNGIPQGSVLSVSLFAVAINILFEKSQNYVKKVLYVDD
ncbi:hypothetical protein JTB14_010102 [Gonioctena quinquepunctata]|nr:hypothetical protein JTB14_010102 [Gonioctena quinquepunctata]